MARQFTLEQMKGMKGRTWTMVLYPESLPTDWEEIISSWGHPCEISPLHDQDVEDRDDPKRGVKKGDLKKPHYHMILRYPNTTTWSKIKKYVDELNQPAPLVCDNIKSAHDYLTHANATTKHQYKDEDIKIINDFNISDYVQKTPSEAKSIRAETIKTIRANELFSFCDVVDFFMSSEDWASLDYVEANSYFISSYIRSLRDKNEHIRKFEKASREAMKEVYYE